jgi:hypothetical protein
MSKSLSKTLEETLVEIYGIDKEAEPAVYKYTVASSVWLLSVQLLKERQYDALLRLVEEFLLQLDECCSHDLYDMVKHHRRSFVDKRDKPHGAAAYRTLGVVMDHLTQSLSDDSVSVSGPPSLSSSEYEEEKKPDAAKNAEDVKSKGKQRISSNKKKKPPRAAQPVSTVAIASAAKKPRASQSPSTVRIAATVKKRPRSAQPVAFSNSGNKRLKLTSKGK